MHGQNHIKFVTTVVQYL